MQGVQIFECMRDLSPIDMLSGVNRLTSAPVYSDETRLLLDPA
jgi:hypothetical protein